MEKPNNGVPLEIGSTFVQIAAIHGIRGIRNLSSGIQADVLVVRLR